MGFFDNLFDKGKSLDQQLIEECTTACREQRIKDLLNKGANPNILTNGKKTPLDYVAEGTLSAVETNPALGLLIERGASVPNNLLATVLYSKRNDWEIAKILEFILSKHWSRSLSLKEATAITVGKNSLPLAELLLKREAPDSSLLAKCPSVGMANILIKYGASTSFAGPKRATLLMSMIPSGSIDVVEYLIRQGIDVNAVDEDGNSALMHGCRHYVPNDPVVGTGGLAKLQEACQRIMVQDRQKLVPMVRLLLKNGADTAIRNLEGYTALDLAEHFQNHDVAQVLREHGAQASYNPDHEEVDDLLRFFCSELSQVTALPSLQATLKRLLLLTNWDEKLSAASVMLVTSLLGRMASIDGGAVEIENQFFTEYRSRLQLSLDRAELLAVLFSMRSVLVADYETETHLFMEDLGSLLRLFRSEPIVVDAVAELLFQMAYVDGPPTYAELALLDLVAQAAHLSQADSEFYNASSAGESSAGYNDISVHYARLKCKENDSDEQIRQQYKKLVKDYHPDVIQGKGLPEEFILFANEKFHEIQEAYEIIQKQRTRVSPPSNEPTRSSDYRPGNSRIDLKIQSLFEQADAAETANRWHEAVQLYEDILELSPEDSDAKVLLARVRKKSAAASRSGSSSRDVASSADVVSNRGHAIAIDLSRCSGCGTCEAVAPECFGFDYERERPYLQVQPACSSDLIQEAIDSCPEGCISLGG